MKVRQYLLSLFLLTTVSLLHAQQKQGYWVLEGSDKGIISYINMIYNGRVVNDSDMKEYWPVIKDNYVASKDAGNGRVTVRWSDPPQKIPFGREAEYISTSYHMDFPPGTSPTVESIYGVHSSWMVTGAENHQGGFTRDGGKYDGTLYLKDFPQLDPKQNYYMIVKFGGVLMNTFMPAAGKTYRYRYYNPDQVAEVTTTAGEDEGEQEGPKIPWGWIVIGGGALGGLVLVGKNTGKDAKNPPKEQPQKPQNMNQYHQDENRPDYLEHKDQPKEEKKEEEEEDEEEKKHSSFTMILYKEFGDTLFVGDEPKLVGARIEEKTPEGNRIDRQDLTAKISMEAEEACTVERAAQRGRYYSGYVKAVKNSDGSVPDTAKVEFMFKGEGGLLINHVVFKVLEAPEIVVDDAITFEAEGGKTQFMEFGINNFNGVVKNVKVSIEEGGAKFFTSKLEADKEIPYKFRINLTEKGKIQAPEGGEAVDKDKPLAGDIDRFSCTIVANLDGREEPLKASFDIYRMSLGVRLDINALKGYLVNYDSTYKQETLATDPKVKKKWGESRVSFKFIAEDPETGQINSVIPDQDPVFTFEDVDEGSLIFMDRNGDRITNLCGLMAFRFDFDHVDSDNTVVGVIHSTGGGLMPPNRGRAKVTLSVSYKGKSYEDSAIVPIISQPVRYIADAAAYSRALKEDERKLEQMMHLRSKILCDPKFAELTPFFYKVDALVESYDAMFGIYEPDYEKLMRVFEKYCKGEIGTYFANEEAMQPQWTFSEECFNAFLATYGQMEKTAIGIGARIGLGIITAGVSELVFTPLSATVKMQDYVNKGGDSAVKAFAIASGEVLLWEGVFYVGGKLLKWSGGKAMDFAKGKGWDKKVKDAYNSTSNKLKEAYTNLKKALVPAKESKQVAKQLGSAKGYSTKQLGEKVAEAGKKAAAVKKSSVSKANDAIRKTRQMGDKVFTEQSKLMEECAKEAHKDARKIVDNFKKVMSDPNASKEEIRRATLTLQGNKSAQDLLKLNQTDAVRARFNKEMQNIYNDLDDITVKKLAKKLGVKPDEVKPWKGATGNDADELLKGKKIGADRDVTYQVKGKDGKWVDINEEVMEEAYCEAFNEYHYGFMPADKQQALKTLHKFDQAVVNGETGLESYGKDLQNIIKKEFQTAKLYDPERVAKTFEYKCEFWLKQGNSAKAQAEQLMNMGMVEEAKHVMGYGEKLIEEGIRQNVKQFKRILDPRIQALAAKGVGGKNYEVLYEKIHILDSIGIPPPKDVLPATLEEVRLTLKTQYNTTIEEVVKECSNVIKEVNALLP